MTDWSVAYLELHPLPSFQSFSVNLLWKCCIYNSNNEAYVNYFLWLFTPNYSVVWHYGIIRKCGQSSRYFSIWKTLLQAHGVLDSFAIFFCSLSLKQKWGPVYRTLYYNHLHKPFIWRKHSITELNQTWWVGIKNAKFYSLVLLDEIHVTHSWLHWCI